MDPATILDLIAKGLALLPALIAAGADVVTTIKNLQALSQAGANGTVTDQQLADVEAHLDDQIAKFDIAM